MLRSVVTVACLALSVPAAPPARAHDWYDPACCNGQDCQPVAFGRVTATPEGWRIVVGPGDHILAKRKIDTVVPFGDRRVRQSLDQDFHVCLSPLANTLFCLYVPEFGS